MSKYFKITEFNQINEEDAVEILLTCCASENWAKNLVKKRPFKSFDNLISYSNHVWKTMVEADFLQAFDGHPQIGDVSTLKEKYRNTQGSAAHEQSQVNEASDEVLHALAKGNNDYLEKFGFIFIVFATGKSAQQMLDLLQARLPHSREQELINAANEQNKITQLRLGKLFSN